ncbi:MAG: 23S rRNA (uracil(1939)-C(5))-methyltransferase RlmD, partial [Eubacteriales bacterium]|nr:23S rRNA (uracil(1939)-C(5))-methyltransferase RlmD [Eubacteriales bacterium]
MNTTIKKNSEYFVTIEGYNSLGEGVARIDGFVIFVPKTIVGEVWRIKIIKVASSFIYAKALELQRPSSSRIDPECPYFGSCGGCDTWHMDYSEELSFKLAKVNDALSHIGHQSLQIHEILGSDQTSRYRNKGIFNVSSNTSSVSFGFYRPRSHDLIAIDQCLIQNPLGERVSSCVTRFMERHDLRCFDEETGSGTVRHIFCRSAVYTDDRVACIISARGFGAYTDELVNSLILDCPELTGIILCINKGRQNSVLNGDFYTLYGKPEITDYLGRFEYVISPQSFYQINPPQAERLYAKAVEYACRGETDSCLELYCGSGTISLFLSEKFHNVFATEIVPEAIENAKQNAERNAVENVEFLCGDASVTANYVLNSGRKFDCVVVDPPRKGMDEDAVHAVASIAPDRIVYVSCNPSTLARDILRFNEFDYVLTAGTAVDMFPRTCHVETVVLMSRNMAEEGKR